MANAVGEHIMQEEGVKWRAEETRGGVDLAPKSWAPPSLNSWLRHCIYVQDGFRDVATCKDTTKIQICSLQYVLRWVGLLLTPGIFEHSPLTLPLRRRATAAQMQWCCRALCAQNLVSVGLHTQWMSRTRCEPVLFTLQAERSKPLTNWPTRHTLAIPVGKFPRSDAISYWPDVRVNKETP